MRLMKSLLGILPIVAAVVAYKNEDIVSARIESCQGCALNRLPEVKDFIYQDAPKYDNVMVKFIHGAEPVLILLGKGNKELERIPLEFLSRKKCRGLMESKGFIMNKKEL